VKQIIHIFFICAFIASTGSAQLAFKADSVNMLNLKANPAYLQFPSAEPLSNLKQYKNQLDMPDPLATDLNYTALAVVGLGLGTAIYSINNYYQNTWWRDKRTSFKFVNDWKYALWLDKYGHVFGTYLQAHAFSSSLEAANMSVESSALLGAGLAFGMQLYVEIQDGYGPKWGFSPGDIVSDLIGSLYSVAVYYYPYLKNIQPRVSYFPSEEMRNGTKPDMNISDDYEGQKLWLSFRMKKMLPENIAEVWPSWLMLSVGYGVRNLDGRGGGDKEFYFGFDFDAEEIPLHGKFWQFVKNTLNFIHFPMPGIRFSPDAAFLVFAY
jgi:hypothetical protein